AECDFERRFALQEYVLRALDAGFDPIALERHRHANAAFLEPAAGGAGREEQKRSLTAEEVRRRHRAQFRAVEIVGRERDGHAEDRAPDAMLPQDGPERLRAPQQPQRRPSKREPVAAKLEEPRDLPDPRGRKK